MYAKPSVILVETIKQCEEILDHILGRLQLKLTLSRELWTEVLELC